MKKINLVKIAFALTAVVALTINIAKADTDDGGTTIDCPTGDKYICATTPNFVMHKGDGDTPVTFGN